jgi:uncharacterized RDD family membrane protein YckC
MVYQDLNSQKPDVTPELSSFRIAPTLDRFLAFVFDVVLFTPVFGFIMASLFKRLEMMYFVSPNSLEFAILLTVLVVFSFFLAILFQTLFLILMGATPGKYFFKIRVVNVGNSNPKITFSQGLLRSFLWSVEVLFLGLPFLEVASAPMRRALHDRASDTIVVTLKQAGDRGPHRMETHFVRQFLLVISLVVFVWSIFFVGHFYRLALKGEFKKNELERDEYLCAAVSTNLDGDQSRIDKALALYMADEIPDECLAAEADFLLWTPDESEKSWAYLAKGMLKKYDLDVFEAYLDKACEVGEDTEACEIAKYEADPNHKPIPSKSETGTVLQVTQDFEKGRYSEAEKGFLKLSKISGYENFSQAGLVKTLWAQNKVERAKGAYQNVVHQMPRHHQMELAAWICHEEIDKTCSSQAIEACEDLKVSFKNSRTPPQESFVALALLREKECRKTNAVEWIQFQSLFRERKDVLDYLKAISDESGVETERRHQILEDLAFRKESVRPMYLRRFALQNWVSQAKTEQEFQKITQFLVDKKIHDLSWIKIYQAAMKTFIHMRAEKSIREIVQLPSEDLVSTHGLQTMQIQGHYLARNYDKAWSELQNQQQGSRAPASADPLTLDFIKQALGKRKQPAASAAIAPPTTATPVVAPATATTEHAAENP